jgi:hypothetical protein
MSDIHAEIQTMVDRETSAWNSQDADALVDVFHPDMVWAWPRDAASHDAVTWVLLLGRYDRERWRAGWQELFRTHERRAFSSTGRVGPPRDAPGWRPDGGSSSTPVCLTTCVPRGERSECF